ncbi:hypothetical protein EMCRGX_G017176 [Ephydatia muelleri]
MELFGEGREWSAAWYKRVVVLDPCCCLSEVVHAVILQNSSSGKELADGVLDQYQCCIRTSNTTNTRPQPTEKTRDLTFVFFLASPVIIRGGAAKSHRQPFIKLADHSELALVKEYDNSNNSDDKRKIEKTEKAADWTMAKRRRFQVGKQKEGGARKNMARHISEPMLEPKIPFVGSKDESSGLPRSKFPVGSCFRWVTLAIPRQNVQRCMKCVDGGNASSNLEEDNEEYMYSVCVTWQSPTLIDVGKPRRERQELALLGDIQVSVFHTGSRCCEHLHGCWKHLGMGKFFPSTLSLPPTYSLISILLR